MTQQSIRQSDLFAGESWTVLYRAFTEINFAAYDFDTIRNAMISYIQVNYPEDFNDWIQSTEFSFIVDLLAWQGQSLAFRMDMNVRENFIDTAERRESILKMARMLSYNPYRNIPSRGMLKVHRIQTDDDILDSSGRNLNGRIIEWNDANNPDWYEQWSVVLNNALLTSNPFGVPVKEGTVGGAQTELYEFNNIPINAGVFSFSQSINGVSLPFEVVNTDFTDVGTFFEKEPNPRGTFHIAYQNDGNGNASNSTGFFLYFKQGRLSFQDFGINVPVENQVLDVDSENVNELDVWVQSIDDQGIILNSWTKVPTTFGNNIIYNDVNATTRNIFSVTTQDKDKISVRFADGRFGNVPTGIIRVWHRASEGVSVDIRPQDIQNIQFTIPFINDAKLQRSVVITCSLEERINNGAPGESTDSIRANAPRVYYTQNRMVTGEDYNTFPIQSGNALKVKAINRIYSGQSQYFDLADPTGSYQNTKMFSDDGILFKEQWFQYDEISKSSNLTADQIISQYIEPKLTTPELQSFYLTVVRDSLFQRNWSTKALDGLPIYDYTDPNNPVLARISAASPPLETIPVGVYPPTFGSSTPGKYLVWRPSTETLYDSTGMFLDYHSGIRIPDGINHSGAYESIHTFLDEVNHSIAISGSSFDLVSVYGAVCNLKGTPSTNDLYDDFTVASTLADFIRDKSMIYFYLPDGTTKWVTVDGFLDNGRGYYERTGEGKIRINESIPAGSIVLAVLPAFRSTLTTREKKRITSFLSGAGRSSWGLRYNFRTFEYEVIEGRRLGKAAELDNYDPAYIVSLEKTHVNGKPVTPPLEDFSWLIQFIYRGGDWSINTRGTRFVFESVVDSRFYFFNTTKLYNYVTGRYEQDNIKILGINPSPYDSNKSIGSDFPLTLTGKYIYSDGYMEPRRVRVSLPDMDNDGQPDNPYLFEDIVGVPESGLRDRYLFWVRYLSTDGNTYYKPLANISIKDTTADMNNQTVGMSSPKVTYVLSNGIFYDYDSVNHKWTPPENSSGIYDDTKYQVKFGRGNLKFQWSHFAQPDHRIDPAPTNLNDIYILDPGYDTNIRRWIESSQVPTELPTPPSIEQLRLTFQSFDQFKMVSDQIVWHPAKYRLLFGANAEPELQVRFKAIRIPNAKLTDSEIKSIMIQSINEYFAQQNWDFGDTVYWTELAAYLHIKLAANLSSVVPVPLNQNSRFGNLFEIKLETSELPLSCAQVSDIEIVSSYTENNLRANRSIKTIDIIGRNLAG